MQLYELYIEYKDRRMSNELRSYKITMIKIILLTTFFHSHAMNNSYDIRYQEEYADFRLTRPYGTLRSNFDCLPEVILESFINPYLSELVIKKFKKKLLKYKHGMNTWDNTIYQAGFGCNTKTFQYHNGLYTIIPDIAEYGMWDGDNQQLLIDTISTNESSVSNWVRLAFHQGESSEILLLSPVENYLNSNTKFFKIATTKNSNTQIRQIFCEKNITQYLFSCDGNWLSLSSPQESNKVIFIDIKEFQSIEYIFKDPIKAINIAHLSSMFAVAERKSVSFIIPEKDQKKVKIDLKPRFIEFSPNDRYLLMWGNKKIVLCDLSAIQTKELVKLRYACFNFPIQKALFSPNSKTIVMALNNGHLFFWNDFFNTIPIQRDNAFWKKNENLDNISPLILWSKDSQLLFSLIPIKYPNSLEYSFMVRKTKNGKLLMHYAFDDNHPIAMGLTKDEKTVVFTDKKNSLWKFDLYNEEDCGNIDFISKKAKVYQLCYLWNQVKKIKQLKSLKSFQSFIKEIRSWHKLFSVPPTSQPVARSLLR